MAAPVAANVMVFSYTNQWQPLAQRQTCTLVAERKEVTEYGANVFVQATKSHTTQVVLEIPVFPPLGEFQQTQDPTFAQVTVVGTPQKVFGFKFKSQDEAEKCVDDLKLLLKRPPSDFNMAQLPQAPQVAALPEPLPYAPPEHRPPSVSGKVTTTFQPTAQHAALDSRYASVPAAPNRHKEDARFYASVGRQNSHPGHGGRDDHGPIDGEIALAASTTTRQYPPQSPQRTRTAGNVGRDEFLQRVDEDNLYVPMYPVMEDISGGENATTDNKATEPDRAYGSQGRALCEMLQRAVNSGDSGRAYQAIADLIAGRIQIRVAENVVQLPGQPDTAVPRAQQFDLPGRPSDDGDLSGSLEGMDLSDNPLYDHPHGQRQVHANAGMPSRDAMASGIANGHDHSTADNFIGQQQEPLGTTPSQSAMPYQQNVQRQDQRALEQQLHQPQPSHHHGNQYNDTAGAAQAPGHYDYVQYPMTTGQPMANKRLPVAAPRRQPRLNQYQLDAQHQQQLHHRQQHRQRQEEVRQLQLQQRQQQQENQRLITAELIRQRQMLQEAAALKEAARKRAEEPVGWTCPACTLINPPSRPGCSACASARPDDYRLPDRYEPSQEEKELLERTREVEERYQAAEEEERQRLIMEKELNYQAHLQTDGVGLVPNTDEFDCPVCFVDYQAGEGAVLRECLHTVCKDCLTQHIRLSEDADVKCPCVVEDIQCDASITEREIRELLGDEIDKWWGRGIRLAEQQADNSYHCKTADCPGWCVYEDNVETFKCYACEKENCLMCKAIHTPMNCKEYQEDLKIKAANDEAARATQQMLDKMVANNEAMHCPKCKVIVQKASGCDWMKCVMCKTELCWATKGLRWGPKGPGDTSGGCRCRVNGKPCMPKCGNCH